MSSRRSATSWCAPRMSTPPTPAPCSRKRTSTAPDHRGRGFAAWTNQAKKEVLRNSVVFVQIPKGVDWGDGKTVHLAIGLAGTGDENTCSCWPSWLGVAAAGNDRAAAFVNQQSGSDRDAYGRRRPGGGVMQAPFSMRPTICESKSAPCRRSRPRRCRLRVAACAICGSDVRPSASAPAISRGADDHWGTETAGVIVEVWAPGSLAFSWPGTR